MSGDPRPATHAPRPAPRDPRPAPRDPHLAIRAPLGLYVHVPFCSAICNYCNFNRGLYDEALKNRYVDALVREIAQFAGAEVPAHNDPARSAPRASRPAPRAPRPADTIFFGGGTPSLLEPEEIARIIAALRDRFAVDSNSEITLETNPETVDRNKLERFRAAGVNRLSFGVQSFQDAELRRLGRIHSADRARKAVEDARAAGFDNVSLDLMMWLPGQSIEAWLANVDALIAAEPDHASLYLLELYPNAPLKEEMARSGWSLAPDEDAADMYLRAMERLETAGLVQYEISNVARPGRASRHNLKYWSDGEWLGFGCGAHSTMGRPIGTSAGTALPAVASATVGARWKNVAGTEEYIRRVTSGETAEVERHVLTAQERFEDALFTGLRLREGIDAIAVGRRYGVDVFARYADGLAPFLDAGWLVREGPRLRLTRDGMLMANEVMAVFV